MSRKTGFLGRFQPFHLGHYKVVEKYQEELDEFCIVIGSADKSRTEDNPLTLEERKKLIKACFPNIEILSLEDTEKTPKGNRKWAQKLEELGLEQIISGNDLVKEIIGQSNSMAILEPEMHDEEIYSGSEIRRRVKSGEEWRYLTPKCNHDVFEDFLELIKGSGTQYNFEPGWEKENAYHGTTEK